VYNITSVDSKLINPRHRKTGVLPLRMSLIQPLSGREHSFKEMRACISFLSAEHVNNFGYTVEIAVRYNSDFARELNQ
jgi:hypothetical protein